MGRHHDKKYGTATQQYGRTYGKSPGMAALAGPGGLMTLAPLLGLGAVAAIVFIMIRKKRALACAPICAAPPVACAVQQNCATVGINEKLVAAERLPGVKYREVDVITRKKVITTKM
jgi:hypothetical protein